MNKKTQGSNTHQLLKIHRSLLKAWWIFATVCFVVVALSITLVIFYINTLQDLVGANGNIPLQSSSDILNLSIPILTIFAGFLVSFLGMKRFENIDSQLEAIKKELFEWAKTLVKSHNETLTMTDFTYGKGYLALLAFLPCLTIPR